MNTVSLIIVNYNGLHLLPECLESLRLQTFRDFEIIIVDNASRDGSGKYIAANFPEVKRILLPLNIGFGGANNEGLKQAHGEFIALLNNDAEADRDWLRNLVDAMAKNPAVGICASKMLVHGTQVIDSAGDGFSTNLKGFKRGEGQSADQYSQEEYVFGACAGAALYRKKMLDEIGFFDESFFLLHEDTDLNLRAQLAGWKVLYVPAARVFHKVRSSIGDMSDLAIYYSLRNSELVRLKNIPAGLFLRCSAAWIIGIIADFFFFAVRYRKLKLYVQAKADVLKSLRLIGGSRKKIMKLKKADVCYLHRIMTPLWSREFFRQKAGKFFRRQRDHEG
ncbi:MAG: glycosyltransferase family 2 protein [Nitrospirae bacterium]|nr:glycosyltransferase family 2 protein [Nitrospirota bacterium]